MKKILVALLGFFTLTHTWAQYLEIPIANIESGVYTEDVMLELDHVEDGVSIFYTLNGEEPTVADNLYTGPISLSTISGEPDVY